jgi:hypothetical protein
MAVRFSHGFRTSATGVGAVAELIGGTGSERVKLVEVGLMINAQTLTALGLGYSAVVGQTPTSPVTLLDESDGSLVTTVTDAMAWATPPTAPTNAYYFRRATLGLGSDEIIWKWPPGGGLLLLPATSLVLYLFATGSVLDGWWTVER